MKTKGIFRVVLSMMFISVVLITSTINAYASTGSKKVTTTFLHK